jgi:hypothetical protein
MSWENVDNKHKKKYDRYFVSCDEVYEREFIINTILEEFPRHSRFSVERAVDHCCKTISAPRERKEFLKCVENQLK